jgi:hypothetical protein
MAQKISLSELKKIVKKTLKEESDSELKKVWGYDYYPEGLYADYEKQKIYTKKQLEKTFEHLDQLVEYFLEVVQDCEDNLAELKSTVNSGNYLMSDYEFLRDKFLELVQESRFALVDIVTEDSPANSIKRITSDTEKLRQLRKKIENEID